MNNDTVYENEELRLREITPADLECIRNWHNESNVGKWFPSHKPTLKNAQKKWYKDYKKDNTTILLIVEEKKALSLPIGIVNIHIIDEKKVEFVGFNIGEKLAKGKGYGIKIMYLAQEYIFKELKAKYSILEVYCDNRPAVNTYVKAGYRINDIFEKDGRDMYIMRAVNRSDIIS